MQETSATHCFSACLYHEPAYQEFFPSRSFRARFLDRWRDTSTMLKNDGIALNVFCDEAMLDTALRLGYGSVYLVTENPLFPFDQHIWRYLSSLLPQHSSIKCYHFRGMDNIVRLDLEKPLWATLEAGDVDIIHAPYHLAKLSKTMPVRGSFSAGRYALTYLARWLRENPRHQRPTKTSQWHSDELFLADWWDRDGMKLTPLTILDREIQDEWLSEMLERARNNEPFQIVRI